MSRVNLVSDLWFVAIGAAYATTAWLLSMYRVVAPRDWLCQRIRHLDERIAAESWRAGHEARENLQQLLETVQRLWLLLPISRVQAGWRHVHSVEDDHILEMPGELVDEGLRDARESLGSIGSEEAGKMIERIDLNLAASTSLEARRALLQSVSVYRHDVSDRNYEDAAAVLAKAVLLSILAVAIATALGILLDRETYFLFGAAGALLSRLTRVLREQPKASDYGAAWSTLILSPAGGALTGWLGVSLVAVLAAPPLDVLNAAFRTPWDDALSLLGFAVAFLSGFSERWFTRLVGAAEAKLSGQLPKEGS